MPWITSYISIADIKLLGDNSIVTPTGDDIPITADIADTSVIEKQIWAATVRYMQPIVQ